MSLSADASKDLPSVDANPMSQLNAPNRLKFMVQCRKRIAHLDSGRYSPQSVIVAKPRHAKHGHDVVTGGPLDDATVPLDYVVHFVKVAGE